MIGKLIVSHGDLARELLLAAKAITGDLESFEALCLDWHEGAEEAQQKIRDRIARLDQGEGVLILTDMFGDTPCNASLTFLEPGHVEVVTGVNLPMVVRLGCLPRQPADVAALARWTRQKGIASIRLASDSCGDNGQSGKDAGSEPER